MARRFYAKVSSLSFKKQLLFEVGLCEVLYALVAELAKDEDRHRLNAYRTALGVVRRAAQDEALTEATVAQARKAVESLIPDDDDPSWCWTNPIWENAGISIYYTLGLVSGDENSGFSLTHYIEASDYIIQSTSGLNIPLSDYEREPFFSQAHQIVADMVQTVEDMDLTPESLSKYYRQLSANGHHLASIAESLHEECGVRATV